MKAVAVLMVFWCGPAAAQEILRINEVLPRPAFHSDAALTLPWVELYNAGSKDIDLQGMRLVLDGRTHHIAEHRIVPAGGHTTLRSRTDQQDDPGGIVLELGPEQGALLLIGADGSTILDVFSWNDAPAGTSLARMPDGSAVVAFDPNPSPGLPNPHRPTFTRITEAPVLHEGLLPDGRSRITLMPARASDQLRCTLDGSTPSQLLDTVAPGTLEVSPGTALRCRAFSPDGLPSRDAALTTLRYPHEDAVAWLMTDPAYLWNDSTGIYTPGLFDNHTRKGRAWERPALLGLDAATPIPIGIRIAGSGSRSLAKRSFKVIARPGYDSPAGLPFQDGTHFAEGTLRADASPHAFLRNRLMEVLVQRHALAVDMQPSTPVPLYLNGRYWGLYRWMPAKDAQWLRHLNGGAAVDVLAGPAFQVRSGSDTHFQRALHALLSGAPMDTLEALLDLNSLIDLACIDIWTGRGDHDLNVRCHRPHTSEGRWRWVLYDMDLWSTPQENSVERLGASHPSEAPFAPALFTHPELQEKLLARLVALMATAFHPHHVIHGADSLHERHVPELERDHLRWALELEPPTPTNSLLEVQRFAQERPEHLMKHLAKQFGRRARLLVIEAPEPNCGTLWLEGLRLTPGRHSITTFHGVPLSLRFEASDGYELLGWKGVDAENSAFVVNVGNSRHVRPVIERCTGAQAR